jgi:hypothetical protein
MLPTINIIKKGYILIYYAHCKEVEILRISNMMVSHSIVLDLRFIMYVMRAVFTNSVEQPKFRLMLILVFQLMSMKIGWIAKSGPIC